MKRRNTLFVSLLLVLYLIGHLAPSGSAQDARPLEVIGPDGHATKLSLAEIEAMEQTEFDTSTIWTDGEIHFSGVPVMKLLQHIGVNGNTLVMSALNDYSMEMPVSELEEYAPIIATRMNGELMSVRDKGPYWVIFPFDEAPDRYRTETNHARSVWQLVRLSVVE